MNKIKFIFLNIIIVSFCYGQPNSEQPFETKKSLMSVLLKSVEPLTISHQPEVVPLTCENNQILHNNTCAYCPSNAIYNKWSNKCECLNTNEIIGQTTTTSDNKTYFECIGCPANLIPNKDKTKCVCAEFGTNNDLNCTNYSTNQVKYNRTNGTYTCNEAEHVLAFDKKNNLIKCFTCPSDARYDKNNKICTCTEPDAKNPTLSIEYAPTVEDDELVCNPNI